MVALGHVRVCSQPALQGVAAIGAVQHVQGVLSDPGGLGGEVVGELERRDLRGEAGIVEERDGDASAARWGADHPVRSGPEQAVGGHLEQLPDVDDEGTLDRLHVDPGAVTPNLKADRPRLEKEQSQHPGIGVRPHALVGLVPAGVADDLDQ